ncbi:hypothetical protein D0Z00_002776 [Geotrichum galactomycetum]|uniref:Uncharacterized protein n=1 Tax=Geotrichum galactomycetum TaxID=27317 RepID=A0ACB6V356_9ASCO|nr:hypothetical protein D0Z00_002776 [Geotrichum candidum]
MASSSTTTTTATASSTIALTGDVTVTANVDRFWNTLHESCQWGATPDGGMNRLALNDDDLRVRQWFIQQGESLGLTIKIDQVGNIFMIRAGENNDIAPIGIGSHLDTQPRGGRYDGILGVQCGLEIIRALHDANFVTYAPIAVIMWTNEEGARFPKAMLGSGVWAQSIPLQDCYALEDVNASGTTFLAELERIGFKGTTPADYRENSLSAHFELHIEQGPVLEAEGFDIGIVDGVQGMRWYEASATGAEAHTGTTPMNRRRDTLVAVSKMIVEIEETAIASQGLGTVGIINSLPQSTNTIPGHIAFSIDLRHSKESSLDEMQATLFTKLEAIAAARKVNFKYKQIWNSVQLDFDARLKEHLKAASTEQGLPYHVLQSGAGHDSCYTSLHCPTAMLFVPCKDGISHNPAESATKQHCAQGVQVVLGAVLRTDQDLRKSHN